MVNFKNISGKIILFGFIFLFASMFSVLNVQAQVSKTVQIEELSAKIPDSDWQIKRDPQKIWEVTMFKEKSSIVKVVGYSIIKITKDSLSVVLISSTKKEISDSIFHREYKLMESDTGIGNYDLLDTNISVKTISGKEFYSFYFRTMLHKKPNFDGDNILYIYFPDDFNARHVFYKFMINEYVTQGTLFTKNDTDIINPVLESIKINLK